MNKLNLKIGKILKDHRQIKHLTQLDLAKKLGYDSTQFVSLFERGLSKCPTKTLSKLCKILEIEKKTIFLMLMDNYRTQLAKEFGLL